MEWVMPEWMERFRESIVHTGGNSVESLMNDKGTNAFNNHIRLGLITAVHGQVALLNSLHAQGLLIEEG